MIYCTSTFHFSDINPCLVSKVFFVLFLKTFLFCKKICPLLVVLGAPDWRIQVAGTEGWTNILILNFLLAIKYKSILRKLT